MYVEMSKINTILGPQATKIYPQGHVNNPTATTIQQVHSESNQYYKDFMANHKQTSDQFKVFFAKFDMIFSKLKTRDKSLEVFKHYFDKVKKMREDFKFNKSQAGASAVDPAKLGKEEEKLARNEKKYQTAWGTFTQQNNWLYTEVTDLIRNKYKTLTPMVIRFISVAQAFFAKAGTSFGSLGAIQDRARFGSSTSTVAPVEQQYSTDAVSE
jgi:hypothetical protein